MALRAEERGFFTLKPGNSLSTHHPATLRAKEITVIDVTMLKLLMFDYESKAMWTLVSHFTIVSTVSEADDGFMITTIFAIHSATTRDALKR